MGCTVSSTAAEITPEIVAILTDAARRGIVLQATDGSGGLRFRPRSAMTADLTERIKANKPALLALLILGLVKIEEPMSALRLARSISKASLVFSSTLQIYLFPLL